MRESRQVGVDIVVAHGHGEGQLDNLVEEGAELALVFFGQRAEFGDKAFHHHVVVDGQDENAVVHFKKVFKQLQNLHGNGGIEPVQIVDEKDEAALG